MFPVPSSVASSLTQWYGATPSPKRLPFACYLQHFRVTTLHLQPICSSHILPTKYLGTAYGLCTTCMLSTYYYLYTSIIIHVFLFPLMYGP